MFDVAPGSERLMILPIEPIGSFPPPTPLLQSNPAGRADEPFHDGRKGRE